MASSNLASLSTMSRSNSISRADAYKELERGVKKVLERYSNVHRGKGHHSEFTTECLKYARRSVKESLSLDDSYEVIF